MIIGDIMFFNVGEWRNNNRVQFDTASKYPLLFSNQYNGGKYKLFF